MVKKLISIVLSLLAVIMTIFSLFAIVGSIVFIFADEKFIEAIIVAIISFALFFTAKSLHAVSVRTWKESRFIRKDSIKVTLMGGRGVGKTSLLTAMYEQFGKIPHLNLDFFADSSTSQILSNCLKELQSQIGKPETGTLAPTVEQRQYKFHVGPHGKRPIFDLVFRDFPGDFLEEKQINDKIHNVIDFIKDSDAIVIAVDMPALLEDDGRWRETINHCLLINNLFQHGLNDNLSNDNRKLVLLVPIKCEKYLQNGQHQHLLQSIKNEYAGLINHLGDAKEHITVAVVPIQTLGGVVFDSIQANQVGHGETTPRFLYKKSPAVQGYSPCDTDQPLRHILAFSISLLAKQIDLEPKKVSKAFREDQRTLYEGIKNKNGFEILQGQNLLKP